MCERMPRSRVVIGTTVTNRLGAPFKAGPEAAGEGDPESYLEPSPEARRGRAALVAGGLDFPVVGSQGVQPHLAGYLDLPRALQLGLKARVDLSRARNGYDYIPQVALHLRQLWLSDQDSSTVRNSEYFSVIVGGYYAYDFLGNRAGPRPFVAFSLGKNWMPFNNQPFGLDFCLEIDRYFDGVPQRTGPWGSNCTTLNASAIPMVAVIVLRSRAEAPTSYRARA